MASRAYDMSRRARAVDAAREAALSAAYALLADPNCHELSVDATARAAGVTRATLYNQFGSRSELLVAVFRDLGRRMKADRIYVAMRLPDPVQALTETVRESTRAYARERQVIRKLFALAALDAEVQVEVERSERQRRQSLVHLVARLAACGHTHTDVAEAAAMLASLTSFQVFEALSFDVGPRLTERRLLDLAQVYLGISNNEQGGIE
ncbi:MAG TPA: TetR/AcrR family transcriptional regulator [Polyangiaceae bacterium]|nr:TetR/AcrR family transcriptional regulator [Polyangiaceae bacterium]